MRKKCSAMLLAVVMVVAMLPTTAFAADSDFVIEDGKLTGYNGPGGNVVIPDGVTSIGSFAFYWCENLTGVTIPASVTKISSSALSECPNLTSISVASGNPAYCSVDNVLFSRDMTILYQYAAGKSGQTYDIPASVTTIDQYAFEGCVNLTDITIPNSVTSIGTAAFMDCASLTGITIPGSVTSIGASAFEGCVSLTGMVIPDGITFIEDGTFFYCYNLTNVTIPDSVTHIGAGAFSNCTSLTKITIPASVTAIDINAFMKCSSLTDVYYGGSEAQWKEIVCYINPHGDKATFASRDGLLLAKLTNVTVHYNSTGPEPEPPQFTDVDPGDPNVWWYVDAVSWAAGRGITVGTSDTTFSPLRDCTHVQILTFLWRAEDKPVVETQAPIKGENADYQSAMHWAYEMKMIDETFQPNAECTRADAMYYIWQAFGSKSGAASSGLTDVPADYTEAVNWAVANGIAAGTGGSHFTPDKVCNRGTIATFLHRAYVESARL